MQMPRLLVNPPQVAQRVQRAALQALNGRRRRERLVRHSSRGGEARLGAYFAVAPEWHEHRHVLKLELREDDHARALP